jgi:hypothetical protein
MLGPPGVWRPSVLRGKAEPRVLFSSRMSDAFISELAVQHPANTDKRGLQLGDLQFSLRWISVLSVWITAKCALGKQLRTFRWEILPLSSEYFLFSRYHLAFGLSLGKGPLIAMAIKRLTFYEGIVSSVPQLLTWRVRVALWPSTCSKTVRQGWPQLQLGEPQHTLLVQWNKQTANMPSTSWRHHQRCTFRWNVSKRQPDYTVS